MPVGDDDIRCALDRSGEFLRHGSSALALEDRIAVKERIDKHAPPTAFEGKGRMAIPGNLHVLPLTI